MNASPSSLIVGIVWGDASWQGRINKVSSEVETISNATDSTLAAWKKTAPKPEDLARFTSFLTEFRGWVSQWEKFKAANPWATDPNDAILQNHESRIAQWRKAYDSLSGVVSITTPAPDVYKPPAGDKGDAMGSAADIVKWGVIGGIAIFGLKLLSDSGVLKKGK